MFAGDPCRGRSEWRWLRRLVNRAAPLLNTWVLVVPAKALVGATVVLLSLWFVAGELGPLT